MFTREETKKITVLGGLVLIGIIFNHVIGNMNLVMDFGTRVLGILSPIFVAFAIAYIVNIPMRTIEYRVFRKLKVKQGTKRGLALITTAILLIGFIVLVVSFALPQLTDSVAQLVNQVPNSIDAISTFFNQEITTLDIDEEIMSQILGMWQNIVNGFMNFLSNLIGSLYMVLSSFLSGLFNTVLSIVLAIYMLLSKETLNATIRKVMDAFLKQKTVNTINEIFEVANKSFTNFFRGQLMEALILGIICYIGMVIMRFDYALLISMIIGMTNIIPLFGPYIGFVPSFLILLTVNPIRALWFILYVIVLQQVEGNIIYPRVVGNSIGISGFWILVVVIIGNSLFGIMGILVGIPVFSTCSILFNKYMDERIKKKSDMDNRIKKKSDMDDRIKKKSDKLIEE